MSLQAQISMNRQIMCERRLSSGAYSHAVHKDSTEANMRLMAVAGRIEIKSQKST